MPAGSAPPGRQSLRLALAQLVVVAAALAAVEIALFPADGPAPVWALVAYALVGLLYVATGVLAWWRRPTGRIGVLLYLCGLALLVSAAGNVPVPAMAAIGTVAAELPIGVMLHLLLAFPSGRLPDPWSRALVAAGYLVTTVLKAPLYLFAGTGTLAVADRPDLVALFQAAGSAAGFAVIAAAAVVLVRRLRAADTAQRHVLAAVSGYGVFTILFLSLSAIVARVAGLDPIALFVAQLAVVVGLPFAFLAGVLRGGFARTADVDELGVWLGTADGGRPALGSALRRALGDPSLELLFWLPDSGRYVDAAGGPATRPGPPRAAVDVEVAGERVGAIVYDPVSTPEPDLVRRAGRVVALAVERQRLTAELLAGRAALRESRARIVESGDRERRRIARDLHDGLQARLVVLALAAGRLGAHPAAGELRAGVESAIEELRGLVHGIMPALLVQRGLYAATEELLDRVPVSSRFDRPAEDGALPTAVESAGYFTVAEALANAVKHAEARKLTVRMERADGLLTIEVSDDGVGGAGVERGSGLRGIADRVEALGGRLRVDSVPGRGTHLVAELPCGS
jgi:signal transduction histidine kinase